MFRETDWNKKLKALADERKRLLETPGGKLWGSWKTLDDAWLVLSGNALDAIRVESYVNSSPEAMIDLHNHMDDYLAECRRKFHNFLASARSFDDQTRRHLRQFYRGQGLEEPYSRRREDAFASEPVCALVQRLRNMALHYALPEIYLVARTRRTADSAYDEVRDSFCLSPHALLALSRAAAHRGGDSSKQAEAFLESLTEKDLPVSRIIHHYVAVVEPLHNWLGIKEEEVAGAIVDEFLNRYNTIVQEYNRALSGES